MISESDVLKLISCGAIGYPLKRVLNVLSIENVEEFTKDFNTEGTQIYDAYRKGVDIGEFAVDSAIFNKAKEGDQAAIKLLEKRRKIFAAQKSRDNG